MLSLVFYVFQKLAIRPRASNFWLALLQMERNILVNAEFWVNQDSK